MVILNASSYFIFPGPASRNNASLSHATQNDVLYVVNVL